MEKKVAKRCSLWYINSMGVTHTRKIMEKHCSHCKTIKNLMPKPYSVRKNSEGVVTSVGYMCRQCNTERLKKYRRTIVGDQNYKAAVKKSMKKHWHKQQARGKVAYALKTGKLKKPENCSTCDSDKWIEAHHPDYNKPLDVNWLCKVCHSALHHV